MATRVWRSACCPSLPNRRSTTNGAAVPHVDVLSAERVRDELWKILGGAAARFEQLYVDLLCKAPPGNERTGMTDLAEARAHQRQSMERNGTYRSSSGAQNSSESVLES